LQKVHYRAPRGAAWEEKTWDWALERIAARVKETRDKTFKTSENGRVVNRTEAIACLGGSALDNEEAYLLVKLMRALGLVYVEHQARL
jgi:formate dehydrogenase major subunit